MDPQPTLGLRPLIEALDDLELMLPDLRAEYPDPGSLMEAFAAHADPILDEAARRDSVLDGTGCWEMASRRIATMLVDAGWIDEAGTVIA